MLISNMVSQEVQNHQEKQISEAVLNINKNLKIFDQLNPMPHGFEIDQVLQPYIFKDILGSKIESLDYISYAGISQETVGNRAVVNGN